MDGISRLLELPSYKFFFTEKACRQQVLHLEYQTAVEDLITDSAVLSMDDFVQHGGVTCLEHCFFVSYNSFLLCRLLGLDARAAARGGLLHDMFLYDWHIKNSHIGLHAFTHPSAALENACVHFSLSDREMDIILKHMWPLTLVLPKYAEAVIVSFVDKYCAVAEVMLRKRIRRMLSA